MSVPRSILDARGWTVDAVERSGSATTASGSDSVCEQSGDQVGTLRYSPNGAEPKMRAPAETPRELFPPPEMIDDDEAGGVVWLVEGEPDCIRAWSAGVAAVAVPGAQNWRAEWAPRFGAEDGRSSSASTPTSPAGQPRRARGSGPRRPRRRRPCRGLDDYAEEDGFDLTDLLAARDDPRRLGRCSPRWPRTR